MGEYSKYTYSGPVCVYGKCICNHWEACTYATSDAKAKNNLMYQFKRYAGMRASAKSVSFHNAIIKEE